MSDRSATATPAESKNTLGIVTVYTPPAEPEKKKGKEPADPESLFRAGLHLLERADRILEAVAALERAHQSKPREARYASYYGLSLALSSKRFKEAETLCAEAVEVDYFRPELYYNLGRVRLLRNDRKGAYLAFKGGLSLDRNDARIQQELAKLGQRRPPVLPFLSRRQPLNKLLGLLRSQIEKGQPHTT